MSRMSYPHEELEGLAEKAWAIADKLMESDNEWENELGLEFTTVAKVLDEVTGRHNWGILDAVKWAVLEEKPKARE